MAGARFVADAPTPIAKAELVTTPEQEGSIAPGNGPLGEAGPSGRGRAAGADSAVGERADETFACCGCMSCRLGAKEKEPNESL